MNNTLRKAKMLCLAQKGFKDVYSKREDKYFKLVSISDSYIHITTDNIFETSKLLGVDFTLDTKGNTEAVWYLDDVKIIALLNTEEFDKQKEEYEKGEK